MGENMSSLEELLSEYKNEIHKAQMEQVPNGEYELTCMTCHYDEKWARVTWDLTIKGYSNLLEISQNINHKIGAQIFIETLKDLGVFNTCLKFEHMIKMCSGLEFKAHIASKEHTNQKGETRKYYNFKVIKGSVIPNKVSIPEQVNNDLPF